jgi:hypothetical protein
MSYPGPRVLFESNIHVELQQDISGMGLLDCGQGMGIFAVCAFLQIITHSFMVDLANRSSKGI